MTHHPPLVEALLKPDAYPESERPKQVAFSETHISWLFFTGRFVYKVKKPVDFGFLDFTTLEKRHYFCREELRLNRRISPEIYLDVVAIKAHEGRYTIGDQREGKIVDYAVKMLQLPKDRWLKNLVQQNEATPELMRRIARRIADFHALAETGTEITRLGGSLETLIQNAEENFKQTQKFVGITLSQEAYDAIRAYTVSYLSAKSSVFKKRAHEGRIRDGHGDLHIAQIGVENGISFIDCIEFVKRFRYCDVAADLAFTAMDLDEHGHPELSNALVQAYIEFSGDSDLLSVIDYYKCYRAYVRGKVESLRLDQPDLFPSEKEAILRSARRYFDLSHEYATSKMPMLLVVTGLMGSGKSTLAKALALRLKAKMFSSDIVRKELLDILPQTRHLEAWGEGIYASAFQDQTYTALHARALTELNENHIVILDASYRRQIWRDEARSIAEKSHVPRLFLETVCPDAILKQRLAARLMDQTSASDGRLELLDEQKAHFQPFVDISPKDHLIVQTLLPLNEIIFDTLKAIYLKRFGL